MHINSLEKCPACSSTVRRRFELGSGATLYRCRGCRLVYAPTYADPDDIYAEGYLAGQNGAFGTDTSNPVVQELMGFIGNERLDVLERHIAPPGRFLDVGCGSGEMLAAAAARAWDVTGIEPYEESAARARARGFDVRTAELPDAGLDPASFDVVGAFHVLEHMTDAVSFVRLVTGWARPGGYLFVEVPNWAGIDRRSTGAAWAHLRPLEHVAHYTPVSLRATLRRAGLDIVSVRSITYLWDGLDLGQRLDAVLGHRWRRVEPQVRRLPLTDGDDPSRVTPGATKLLRGIEAANGRLGLGFAVLAIARVPPAGLRP